jgi:hypothetical protein
MSEKLESEMSAVMRSYSWKCGGNRERMLEMALYDLWRNYPEWPSTFGPCLSPECDGCGRGSGFCAKCVTGGIADIVGSSDNAEAMRRVIENARQTANKLREMVSPHNYNCPTCGRHHPCRHCEQNDQTKP